MKDREIIVQALYSEEARYTMTPGSDGWTVRNAENLREIMFGPVEDIDDCTDWITGRVADAVLTALRDTGFIVEPKIAHRLESER